MVNIVECIWVNVQQVNIIDINDCKVNNAIHVWRNTTKILWYIFLSTEMQSLGSNGDYVFMIEG
jgi:hypothetical protein